MSLRYDKKFETVRLKRIVSLEIGDEVIVRIIESDKVDTPVEMYKEDLEESKRRRREFYEMCKIEFENE